jgi:hypothetical protein
MKTIFIALGMAVILFLYGYVLSTVGHDHDHHMESASRGEHHAAGDGARHH